jgi:glutamyl/glutaminyl-tRNA synthetase
MEPEARLPAVYHTSLVVQDSGARLEKRTRGVMLTELFAAGETPETIATKFGRSFDSHLPGKILPAAVSGETKRELTMSELGFLQNG